MSNRRLIPFVALVASFMAAGPLTAQSEPAKIGHDPAHSPYRDLRATHQLTASAGFLGGSGGRAGVGPKQGPLGGLRYSISLSGSLELTLGLYAASLKRHLVDPTAPADRRDAGTLTQSVMIADGGFNLRITGAKTWHGLAPYAGASLGAAAGGSVVGDNSGFSFVAPFQWGPHAGVRWYSRGLLSIWVEGWDPIWRLKYPTAFFTAPTGSTPLLDRNSDPPREWVHNPMVLIGFGFTLRT